jgi:hypothetical protein
MSRFFSSIFKIKKKSSDWNVDQNALKTMPQMDQNVNLATKLAPNVPDSVFQTVRHAKVTVG